MSELDCEDLASFGEDAQSAHGFGLAESIKLAEELCVNEMPQIKILAIVGSEFKLGTGLSPSVKNALPRAAEHLEEMVSGFLEEEAVS
jgi:hydrogenase maturation protease